MANGQQKALENIDKFHAWTATQSDDDYKQIIHRGKLNRREVSKAVGCGLSAISQNPAISEALAKLEESLREREILPPLTLNANGKLGKDKQYDQTTNRTMRDSQRLTQLEQKNIELEAELTELKKKHETFQELSETLIEMGMISR